MKHFNRKIKYAILVLFVCLLALISFSKAGILFSANSSSDIITVSTQKKSFNPKVIPEKVELTYNGETLSEIASKLDSKFKGSLTGKGEFFANLCIEKGMDPYLLAAMSVHETAYGKSNAAMTKYNYGGIMCSGKLCTYSSIEDGITKFISMVHRVYYSKGLTTPEQINPKYAADPNWSVRVNNHYYNLKNK